MEKRSERFFFLTFVSRPVPIIYIPPTGNECGRKPIAMYVISGLSWRWCKCIDSQSKKFLDLGTLTRPPSNIYTPVNWSVIRGGCTRAQGHRRNLFRRPWIFGLLSIKHRTWPYHASVFSYSEANFSFQMQQWNFPSPYLRNDMMVFHF